MNWMRFKWLYFLLSSLVIVPGIISLVLFGLRPSIDFTGGTLLELKFQQEVDKSNYEEIQKVIENQQVEISSIQSAGENTILIRMKPVEREKVLAIEKDLGDKFGGTPEEIRLETVGPTLGRELLNKTVIAVVLAALVILIYVARQFRDRKFGICAILAMFHDTLVLLGSFSLLGYFFGVEVDTLFVTAMLTILSFSVHDTVVVYDRIRESQKLFPEVDFEKLADKAVTETLSRSLNNSLTIIFMLVSLLLLGGETIRWFVAALLIGTVSGTYSSTFTAVPLLVFWEGISRKRKK
jgi:preprotein translocase subunit SecF